MDNMNGTNGMPQPTGGDKKKKTRIIIIVAVLVAVLVAGAVTAFVLSRQHTVNFEKKTNGDYEIVTDANGEPVTDEFGEVVTIPIGEVTGAAEDSTNPSQAGNAGNAGGTTAAGGNAGTTTAGGSGSDSAATTKQTIKKPDAPAAVTGVKVTDAGEDSLTVKWDKVKCDGYQISYSEDNIHWTNYPTDLSSTYTSNSLKLSKLTPYTRYYFSVRAYNINEAGASASAWSATVYGDTLEVKKERQIEVTVKLPRDSNKADTLEIWVDNELAYTGDALLNGSEQTVKLDKKYKGVVTVWAGLKSEDVASQKKVGGYEVALDLTSIGIDTIEEEEEL